MAGNMDWLSHNWGSVLSAIGLAATVVGLAIVFHQARKARSSAEASKIAAQQTQLAITGTLTIVDLGRAIAMVQRLKQLHAEQKWEVSLELYQPLRAMLTNIQSRQTIEVSGILEAARQISIIEENIARALYKDREPPESVQFLSVLNSIQMTLEQMSSSPQLLSGEER